MVALASAFVRLRPDPNKQEFQKTGKEMGETAGASAGEGFGKGYTRGADGKLRDHRGKFVKDSTTMGTTAGGKAGEGFAKSFGGGSGKIVGALKSNLKLAAGVFVPVGLAAAVGEIGKIGIAYENNLNIFKAVTKATGKDMDAVAAKARALGADVQLPGVSAAGAAEAMTELAKAGFTVQQSMDAARATLQLARIANISEGQAAEIAANAVNAFGIKAGETGIVVDQLAAAANSSSIEITEASDSFKQAAATFSGLLGPAVGGKEAITELNTAIAILGNNGIKGSDAGTSLKQALLQLTAPAQGAKDIMKELAFNAAGANVPLEQQNSILHGGKKAREGALAELAKLNPKLQGVGDIAYTSAGKMRPLRDIIDLVARGTKGMTQEEKNFAVTQIFGADATRSILALLKGGLPVYDQQRKAVTAAGAAASVAAAKNAGLGGALDNVKSQFENAAISIYNAVKGPLTNSLNSIAGALPQIFADIGAFAGFVQRNIGTIRDWALAIGAVTLALRINSTTLAIQAAGGVLAFIKTTVTITRVTQGWAAAQALLNATLIANPIGLVIVGLVALGAALVLAYKHSETFRAIVQATWAAIKVAIKATIDWFVNTAWPALKATWDAIAAAAMWLWHNAILPAWNGIKAAVGTVIDVIKVYIGFLIAEFKLIASVAMWLWHNIFGPVFAGIAKVIEIFWLAVRVIFVGLSNLLKFLVGRAVEALGKVFSTVFGFIYRNVIAPWWAGVKVIFALFRAYVLGPMLNGLTLFRNFIGGVFRAVAGFIRGWWTGTVRPIFILAKAAWATFAAGIATIYNTRIKPVFSAFIGFIKHQVVDGFKNGVKAIQIAWDKVREYARKPVAFVVNHVINPFIGGLNAAAKLVGIKDRVDPIKGFAHGGQVPGYATGGRISGAPSSRDNRMAPARIPGVGAVKLAGGEYVVNAQDTARALPLLKWINAGMKSGGPRGAEARIGRPMATNPGDGSEGWAFKDGGLIGWAKDVWGAISDPIGTLKKPFESALSGIPGSGMIKGFLVGAARKLVGGAVDWLKGFGIGGDGTINGTLAYHGPKSGRVGAAAAFVKAQEGKPYVWSSAGPGGYDCSGIVSAAYNILKGGNPYRHTFSTGSLPGGFFQPGTGGPLVAGWSHPGQSPAGPSVGHMAGNIAGLPFESTGSSGVRVGARARSVREFAHLGHSGFAKGGMFGKPIQLFDSGGAWPSGTLGANLSGRTEYVDPNRGGSRGGDHFHFEEGAFAGAIIANSSQAEDMVVGAIKSAKKKRRI